MSQTELPSSVVFSSRDLGPGTLSRTENGIGISESRGITIKRHSSMQERTFLLDNNGDKTAVIFEPSDDLDTLRFYREDKPTQHISRNGVYLELGRKGVLAQYNLNDGSLLHQEIDLDSLPSATLPLSITPEDIDHVSGVCEQLKILRTPHPEGIAKIEQFLNEAINVSEPSEQLPLF